MDKTYLDSDRFHINNYTRYKTFSTIKYGGCVIYVRDTYNTNMVSSLSGSNSFSDYLYVNISIPGSVKPLCVGAYYRHNKHDKNTLHKFIDQLDTQLHSTDIRNKRVIIMGDMNIDLTKLSTNNDIELYFNTLTCHNFESHINSPTRVQYNTKSNTLYSATLIDHIFSNLAEYECIAGNILYADSDHYANFLSVSKLKDNHAAKRVHHPLYKRNYSSIDVDLLLSDFNNVDWNINVLNKNITLNEAVLNFTAQLDILCDKHAPLKKVPKRKVNYIYKPWITKQILPYIIAKNKLAAKRHRNPTEFRKARNFVNNLVNASRNKYFKQYFTEHSKDAKKVWEGIRCAIECHKCKSNTIESVIDTKGSTITDSKSIACAFANYFKEIPHQCISKLPQNISNDSYSKYLHNSNSSSMFLSDTDTAEVYDIINTLKSNKSPGPLKFSNHFLKLLNSHISPLISSLINRSFDESLMPECLKIGKQTPVFKGGDNILSNYRPITVVNSIAKVFEKAVNARLTKYLDKFNLLTDNQFGFRAQHATSHAMIKLYDEALTGLDNKSCKTGSVLLDISKAFDCVDHEILLHKLQHYGIRGNVCKWFESFLTNRTHYVEINGIRSDSYTPDIGVPQGSVLGPMLFIIYVNDLPSSSSLFSFSVFADDTSLLLKSCRDVYHNTFITELNKVMDWFKLNKLLLNYKKSQYIFFGTHYTIQYKPEFLLQDLYEVCPHYLLLSEEYTDLEEQLADDSLQRAYVKGEPLLKDLYEVAPYYTTREHTVTNQGILIEQDEVKYLGIIFDNTLKFTTHINNITQKIGKVVGVLWKGRSLPLSIKLKIYYSLIYSQLNFAILVWGSIISKNINGTTEFEHVPKQLKNVNTVHNKAVRALVSARKTGPTK